MTLWLSSPPHNLIQSCVTVVQTFHAFLWRGTMLRAYQKKFGGLDTQYTPHIGWNEKRGPCLKRFATGCSACYALQSPQASCNCTVWWRQHWLTECRCTLWQMYRQHAASAGLSGPGAFPAPRLLLLSSTQAKARHINESILLPIWATVEWRPPWVTLIAPPTNTLDHNGPASTALISYHCRFLTQDKRRDRSMSSKSGV